MNQGYEVEWISAYQQGDDIENFNPDACAYSRRDFEYLHQARAFARKIRKTSPVIQVAYIKQYIDEPMLDAPPLIDRSYIGNTEEIS